MIRNPKQSVHKSYLRERVEKDKLVLFRESMKELLASIKDEEHEEYNKNYVIRFLSQSLYKGEQYNVNTYKNTDLAIYQAGHPIVLFEFKGPGKPDMISNDNLSRKALYELIYYYIDEEINKENTDITHLVVTDCRQYFVFEKYLFYRLFIQDKAFAKKVIDAKFKEVKVDYIYNEIIKPKVESLLDKLEYTYIDLREFEKSLNKDDILHNRKFSAVYKFFSPTHLLRLPFSSDHNTLDRNFYRELLYIMGVEEVVDKGNHKIVRLRGGRQENSLFEQTYAQLEDSKWVAGGEERFEKALELVLTWVNRILFLKLLEAQLEVFSHNVESKFLDGAHIRDFHDLNDLFFQILGKPIEKRKETLCEKFPMVPYLNSSLFEKSEVERVFFTIGSLRNDKIKIFPSSTLVDEASGKRKKGALPVLDYLLSFLSAYDFGAENLNDTLKSKSKTIINASVLGLIFEKINGYKDGSFFTPGFITEYICSQTIRKAVVNKFNERNPSWDCKDFEDLKEKIEYGDRKTRNEANEIINSLLICDPAVGSGHFLVSALNEIIAIKSELKILQDHGDAPRRIMDWEIRVEDDELAIFNEDGDTFQYDPSSPASQIVQETLFEEKRNIIENCLFGVDLNPKSVDICRLRLWIELLKNAYYYHSPDGLRQLKTLPNIDINIKQGNSLASYLPVRVGQNINNSGITPNLVKEYKANVKKYKNAQDKELRKTIRDNITNIKNRLHIKPQSIFEEKENAKENTKTLTMSHALEWVIEFPEAITDDAIFAGFDIIIGNPPYISVQKLQKDSKVYAEMKQLDQNNLQEPTYKTYDSRGDIYTLFVERGLQLLKPGGLLSYIIPNKWTKVMYGQPLRSLFLQKNLSDLVDFGDTQVFADATTYTCIISMSNELAKSTINVSQIRDLKPKTLLDDVKENQEQFPVEEMDDGIWFVSSLRNSRSVKALQRTMTTLEGYIHPRESFYGLKTGLTKAFKVSPDQQKEIAACDSASASLLRPFLQGAGLKAFGKAQVESYLWFLPKGFTAKGMGIDLNLQALPTEDDAWAWFQSAYPMAANHFLPFKDDAKKRDDKGDYWWELRACAYYDKFALPKIFYQKFQVRPCFLYDDTSAFFNDSMWFLSVDDKSLLSVLNSERGWWLISEFCPRIQNGYQLIWDNLRQIPIPHDLPQDLEAIADDLMEAIENNDTESYTKKTQELNKITNTLYPRI